MPFLAPIFTSVLGFFGTAVGKLALSFGLQLLSSALTPKPTGSGSETELRTGNQPCEIILGKVATKGILLTPTVGWGNSYANNERAYVLSSWKAHGIARIVWEGEWRTLTSVTSTVAGIPEWQINGIDAPIFVRLYKGSLTQAADPVMVTNSGGKWKNTNYVAGAAYVVVRSTYNQEKMPSPAELLMEVEGAPLYDPRKDSTVGGSGTHRINDITTWEYTNGVGTNPALQILALKIGFKWGSEMILGEGSPLSELPLADYALAANICDEITTAGRVRYQSHYIARADESGSIAGVIGEILKAMAGTWVPRFDGSYPAAGAARPINHYLTDADIAWSNQCIYSADRDPVNKFNTLSGTYVSPSDFYKSVDFGDRVIASELALDGERLATTASYLAVKSREQAQELSDIFLRQNTFQASATLTLGAMHQNVQPFDRVSLTTLKFGGFTKTFTVTSVNPLGPESGYATEIELEEDSNTVFAASTFDSGRPPIVVSDLPIRQQELANFAASAVFVQGSNGKRPAILFTWNVIDDVTVTDAIIRWRPSGNPSGEYSYQRVDRRASRVVVTDGIVATTQFDCQSNINTNPERLTNWSSVVQVTTGANDALNWGELTPEVQGVINDLGTTLQTTLSQTDLDVWHDTLGMLGGMVESVQHGKTTEAGAATFRQDVRILQTADQSLAEQITLVNASLNTGLATKADATVVATLSASVTSQGGQITALASNLTAVEAEVDGVSAGGLFQVTAEATPVGFLSQIAAMVRGTIGGVTTRAGWFARVRNKAGGGIESLFGVFGKQFLIADDAGNTYAMFSAVDGITIDNARIGNLTATNIQAESLDATVFGPRALGAIQNEIGSNQFSATLSGTAIISGNTFAEVTLNYEAADTDALRNALIDQQATAFFSWNSGSGVGHGGTLRLMRDSGTGNAEVVRTTSFQRGTSTASGSQTLSLNDVVINKSQVRTDGTIRYYFEAFSTGSGSTVVRGALDAGNTEIIAWKY
jgi:hypothetical protein